MSTIGSLFNKGELGKFKFQPDESFVLPDVCIGVEVEIENSGISDPQGYSCLENIKCIKDNSLRNSGAEFIFTNPVFGVDLKESLSNLIDSIPDQATTGFRTSTHVHLDIRDLEPLDIFKIITVYTLMEPLFYEGCNRYDNPFAVPISSSLNNFRFVRELNKLLNSRDLMVSLVLDERDRYYALNLGSISKFGSLEFRMFNSTKDLQRLTKWVNLVMTTRYCMRFVSDSLDVNMGALKLYLRDQGLSDVLNTDEYEYLLKIMDSGISTHSQFAREEGHVSTTSSEESGVDHDI